MSSDISSVSGAGGGGGVAPSVLQIKTRQLIRPPTPETVITERAHDPDISIYCEKCREFMSVRTIQEHRAFHVALGIMGYKGKEQPESVKALLKRRQTLMRDLNKASDAKKPVSVSRLQKINEAYELVKAHLEGTYEDLIQNKENLVYDCKGISLNCSAPCVRAVGICASENNRWKSKMEDTRVFQDYYGNDINKCFFAIYDGYNGRFAADIAANDLHHVFLNELQKVDDNVSCTCTVNLADKNNLADYDLDRKSPIVRSDSLRHILHEESVNIIQQIMHTCESNLVRLRDAEEDDLEADTPTMRKRRSKDPESERVALALHKSYRFLDRYLSYGINETSLVRWSGCSALTLLIDSKDESETANDNEKTADKEVETDVDKQTDKESGSKEEDGEKEGQEGKEEDKKEKETTEEKVVQPLEELGVIHLANAGNSHAVLCRAGKAYRISRDHTLGNAQEKTRVRKAGSAIHEGGPSGRINGILDTTRGLGNYGDPHLKKAVIPDPYTTSVKIDQHAQFLVMASYGLWDVLTDEEVVSLVKQTLLVQKSRQATATVLDAFDKGMSQATTFGEDFGESFNAGGGLDAGLPPGAFDDTVASVIDIDAAEEADGTGQKHFYKNPPPKLPTEGASDGDDEDDQSQITWNDPLTNQPARPPGDAQNKEDNTSKGGESSKVGMEEGVADGLKNFKDEFNDNASVKTDFESMLSAMCDDGNEADIETLTEIHTFYAKSRLSEGMGLLDKKEEYRMVAETISERLVQSALMAGSRENITVMVILLQGCQL